MKKVGKFLIGTIILIAIFLVLINNFGLYTITGHSMNPTLYEGDIVLVQKTKNITHNDLVVFELNGNNMIKRVIALPGETINILDQKVYLNDQELEEPYIIGLTDDKKEFVYPMTLEENTYFLLGDNREESLDSRDNVVGPVNINNIDGKIIKIIYHANS